MNRKMKTLTLMLAGIVSMSIFTGCGSKEGEKVANTETPKAETSQEEVKSEDNKSGETVNLTWWTIGGEPKDRKMVNDAINEYTKEKINVTVDIKYVGWGEYGEKLAKIVQSGEYYDIAFGASINNYQDLAAKGYFADLTDVLPEVAPELYEFIPDDLWKAMVVNGQIIGVPAFKDSAQSAYWVWDKELVEKLGIDITKINTLEELDPALRKIKEDNPSGYPLIIHGLEGINGFMSSVNNFDTLLSKPYVYVKNDDPSATIVSPWEDEGVVKNLSIIHKWFNDGLVNPDAATITEAPKYRPVFGAQGFPHADADWTISSGYPVISHHYAGPTYSTSSIQGSFLSVSAGSKHVEESVKLIELVNTDTYLRNLLAFGIEDTHYKKVSDNGIEILNDGYQVPAYSQGTFFNMYTVAPAPETKWLDLQKHQENAVASPALGFTFNTEAVQNQVAACANIQSKYEPSLMTGTVNPEEVIPKMMEELNKAGYQDILAEAQKQLNEYLGK